MMKIISDQKGFSLLEMLLAIVIVAMLAFTISAFARMAYSTQDSSQQISETQRARYVLNKIFSDISVAYIITPSDEGESVTYTIAGPNPTSPSTTYTISVGANNWLYIDDGSTNQPIARVPVEEFSCSYNTLDLNPKPGEGERLIDFTVRFSEDTEITTTIRALNKLK